jgi:uncharacterized pyridoxamine 5'-phosphate oxidase family protein
MKKELYSELKENNRIIFCTLKPRGVTTAPNSTLVKG